MDRTGITVVTICVILLIFWWHEEQKRETYMRQHQAQVAATNKITTPLGPTPVAPATPSPSPTPSLFDTNTPEQLLVRTNGHLRYTFTSRGGGLKAVELLNYTNQPSPWEKNRPVDTNGVAVLNSHALAPVLAVTGDAGLVGDGNFKLTPTDYGVRAE